MPVEWREELLANVFIDASFIRWLFVDAAILFQGGG